MNASPTTWKQGWYFPNDDVYDTDFYDPDATHLSYDNDTTYFDDSAAVLGYVASHGDCDDFVEEPPQPCNHSTDCTHPGSGMGTGACIGSPPNNTGLCAYEKGRKLVFDGGSFQHHSGVVLYSDGGVRWGEQPVSGGWAGAGTNGGINAAFISNSCGVRPPFFWQELGNIFAGIQVLGIVMPVTMTNFGAAQETSDDADAPDRGTWFSFFYQVNPNSALAVGWVDAISFMAQSEGAPCPLGANNYTYGGGFGVDGCGCHLAVTVAQNATYAVAEMLFDTWNTFPNDANGPTGTGYMDTLAVCNYNPNTYPWVKQ